MKIRRYLLIIFSIAYFLPQSIAFGKPVLFFSDLDSGPATGNGDISLGQTANVNGALVSIWGKNLGDLQGTSKISIGGRVAEYVYSWGNAASLEKPGGSFSETLYDSHQMQKITFQVPAGADNSGIRVTVGGEDSNIIPFIVRSGNIYFVDDSSPSSPGSGTYNAPWRSPTSYVQKLAGGEDGAICYFREGVYAEEYGGIRTSAKSIFYVNSNVAGAPGKPNAFVGYPNEIASLEATQGTSKEDPNYFIAVINDYPYNSATYLTISSLRLEANTYVATVRSNWRFIGNLCVGGAIFNQGTGILVTGSHISHVTNPERYVQNYKIYGNVITGERTGNKLDHAVYFGASKNNDFGWNYLYKNNVAEGPILSNNSEDSKENGYLPLENLLVHDNVIDMKDFPSRAIGVHELSLGSSIKFYNNIIIGPTALDNPAFYALSASIDLYNNTFYNVGSSKGTSAILSFDKRDPGTGVVYYPEGIKIKNNIVYGSQDSRNYLTISESLASLTPQIEIDSNMWYGIGDFGTKSLGLVEGSVNTINSDPNFQSLAPLNLHINKESLAVDNGTISVKSVVSNDFDGEPIDGTTSHIGALKTPTPLIKDINFK